MKATVQVLHDERVTFDRTFRSEKAARETVQSRIRDCLLMGLTVTLEIEEDDEGGEWWVVRCEREGAGYVVRWRNTEG